MEKKNSPYRPLLAIVKILAVDIAVYFLVILLERPVNDLPLGSTMYPTGTVSILALLLLAVITALVTLSAVIKTVGNIKKTKSGWD